MNWPLHILCVEDSDEDYALIGRELKKLAGPFVLMRAETRETYEKALDAGTDVILCDNDLPSFSSTKAFEIMRSRSFNIPFILVTATVTEEEGVDYINRGMDDYILKDRLRRLPSAIVRAVKLAQAERDRARYYNALLSRERRFRAIVEHSTEAFVLCDTSLEITYASPAFEHIFKVNENTARGKKLSHVIHARHPDAFTDFCDKVLHSMGKNFSGEFEVLSPDSGSVWIECNISNLVHDEHANAVVLNIRDNTQRIKSEQSLRRTQAVLSATIANSEISYVLVDREFRTVIYNASAKKGYLQAFGKELAEGVVIFDYLPEYRKESMRQLFKSALNGKKLRYEISFRLDDGVVIWYDVNVFPVFEDAGQIIGAILATEDITGRKNAEIEKDRLTCDVIAQNKNLEQFAYILSHNLRSPVANILGLAALLDKNDSLAPGDIDRCIKGLATGARNIDQVIRDLNVILETKEHLSEGKQRVDMADLTHAIVKTLSTDFEMSGSTISTDFQVRTYEGIRTYLHSIFLNLISNSLRYRQTNLPARISLRSFRTDNKVTIIFEDNGMGIDLKTQGDKIFKLYKRFHEHTEGRGIGLYMVKNQVELMGGTINVESEVGKGARFIVELPLFS